MHWRLWKKCVHWNKWLVSQVTQYTVHAYVTWKSSRSCSCTFSGLKKNLRQSWLPAFWRKVQNTQEIKRTLFDWTKQDKTCTFLKKSSFSSYVQYIKNRKTNNSTYLVSVGCGRLAEGKGTKAVQVELIVCFSAFMLYVAWKKGLPREFACFVLFRPIKKRSFNLLRVLDLLSG